MTFFLVRPFLCFIYGIFSLGGQIPYFSTKSQYFHCSFCPEGGGQTSLPISMGGHGRFGPPGSATVYKYPKTQKLNCLKTSRSYFLDRIRERMHGEVCKL